jgi:hypothetical protein
MNGRGVFSSSFNADKRACIEPSSEVSSSEATLRVAEEVDECPCCGDSAVGTAAKGVLFTSMTPGKLLPIIIDEMDGTLTRDCDSPSERCASSARDVFRANSSGA